MRCGGLLMISLVPEIRSLKLFILPGRKGLIMKSKPILRRDFLKTSSIGALTLSSPGWRSSALQGKTGALEIKTGGNRGQVRTTVAEDVGSWVAKLRYEDLPPQIIQKAKRVLLDTLGCALGAVDPQRNSVFTSRRF